MGKEILEFPLRGLFGSVNERTLSFRECKLAPFSFGGRWSPSPSIPQCHRERLFFSPVARENRVVLLSPKRCGPSPPPGYWRDKETPPLPPLQRRKVDSLFFLSALAPAETILFIFSQARRQIPLPPYGGFCVEGGTLWNRSDSSPPSLQGRRVFLPAFRSKCLTRRVGDRRPISSSPPFLLIIISCCMLEALAPSF